MKKTHWLAGLLTVLALCLAAPALADHGKPSPGKGHQAKHHAQHQLKHHSHPGKVTICHHPQGHPTTNGVTLRVGWPGAVAHLKHHRGDHRGACTTQESQKAPKPVKPLGTLEVKKVVVGQQGSTDQFNLSFAGKTYGPFGLGGGTSGAQQVSEDAVTVTETAGNQTTDLARYTTSYSCTGNENTPSGTGSGQSFSISVERGETVVCTITNTRVAEASGSYSYTVGDNVTRNVTFDAYTNNAGQALGSLTYSDSNNDTFTANVQCVLIQGSTAYFSGQVTAATGSLAGYVGQYLLQKVTDATPDTTAGAFYATSQCATLGTVQPSADYPVSSGNVTVWHS